MISCIIPAYNEAERIGAVLAIATTSRVIDEVIVVDDGSQDATAKVAASYAGVRVVRLPHNRGKSRAVQRGLAVASHDIIMLLDADLKGLLRSDLERLARPVLDGKADVTLSLRKNSLLPYLWAGIDFVSGERVFHKRVLGDPRLLSKLQGFGLEVYFNDIIVRKRLRVRVVPWDHAISIRKSAKVGLLSGWWHEALMVFEILRTIGPFRVLYQIWTMRHLSRSLPATSSSPAHDS